jgi:hypothetical protein
MYGQQELIYALGHVKADRCSPFFLSAGYLLHDLLDGLKCSNSSRAYDLWLSPGPLCALPTTIFNMHRCNGIVDEVVVVVDMIDIDALGQECLSPGMN